MKGPQLSDGYSIFNSPEQLRANLLEIDPERPFVANFVTTSPLFRTPNFRKRAFPDRSLASNPNASAQDLYNQYRQGFGSTNITSVLDPRRIEIGMRFKF